MAFCDRREDLLDIPEGENILKIVDEGQKQNVVSGVFFLHRRREQIVFCVIVDHGLCKHLVLADPPGRSQVSIHEGCHLIHIQVNIGNIRRIDAG